MVMQFQYIITVTYRKFFSLNRLTIAFIVIIQGCTKGSINNTVFRGIYLTYNLLSLYYLNFWEIFICYCMTSIKNMCCNIFSYITAQHKQLHMRYTLSPITDWKANLYVVYLPYDSSCIFMCIIMSSNTFGTHFKVICHELVWHKRLQPYLPYLPIFSHIYLYW